MSSSRQLACGKRWRRSVLNKDLKRGSFDRWFDLSNELKSKSPIASEWCFETMIVNLTTEIACNSHTKQFANEEKSMTL